MMTLEQIVNALQILLAACGQECAAYSNGTFTTYDKGQGNV